MTAAAVYQIPVFTTWNGGVHAAFINDDFKVTGKLTVTLGLRFDYQTPFSERWNRFSNFDPTAPNPRADNFINRTKFASRTQTSAPEPSGR